MSQHDSPPAGPDPFASAPRDSLRLLQFTDTHLYADPGQRLLGVRTQQSFNDCLEQARPQLRQADMVILSGDLVHDGSEAGYLRLRDAAAEFGCPVLVIPGNHDHPAKLAALVGGDPVCKGYFRRAPWQIIGLDSSLPDSDAGHLDAVQLRRLQQHLEHAATDFTLIVVHHPPVAIGSAWMDRIGLGNADALFATLAGRDRVRAVLCGHVHQELDVDHHGVRVLASPSTCVQFEPHSHDFGVDPRPPGYRWMLLHADGSIETGIHRLQALPAGLEVQSGGY